MKRCLQLLPLLLCLPLVAHSATNTRICDGAPVCLPSDVVNLTTSAQGVVAGTSFSAVLKSSKGVEIQATAVAVASAVGEAADCVPSKRTDPATGFCLMLPMVDKIADDSYSVHIKMPASSPPSATPPPEYDLYPSQLVVQRPVIAAVAPAAAFQDEKAHANIFTLLGRGFLRGQARADVAADETPNVTFAFTGAAALGVCGSPAEKDCYDLKVNSDRQITLTIHELTTKTELYARSQGFSIAVDGVAAEPNSSVSLTLISHGPGVAKIWAVVTLLFLALILVVLLMSGKSATSRKLNDRDYWLSMLFYDVQTNSYSLSKCQFYAWTATAVLGYVYLAVSKSFVQGSGVFPDIPPGLPGILLASVGTVVVSTGITNAKGNKGAGNPGPNLSDFVCTGGVVAPDRLQFLIWTIIGIGTFLSIVWQSDPRSIDGLPTIPPGFMQLMGLSSAGYLAGKLVRKAGPTLTAVAVTSLSPNPNPPAPGGAAGGAAPMDTLRFELTGSGLSKSAIFMVDDTTIFPDPLLGDKGEKGPQVLRPDPAINDPDFGSVIAFTIPKPQLDFLGKHIFTITNPDAQKAVLPYQVFTVSSVTATNPAPPPAPAPAPPQTQLTITGNCLDANLTVQCATPGFAPVAVAMQSVTDAAWIGLIPAPALVSGTNLAVTVADKAGSAVARSIQVA